MQLIAISEFVSKLVIRESVYNFTPNQMLSTILKKCCNKFVERLRKAVLEETERNYKMLNNSTDIN